MASDDEKEDKEREVDPDCPVITVTKGEKARLRAPWRQSLIIKVMGQKIGYAYLLKRLNTIWHPKSKMELITLGNDYYLVKFGSKIDYEFAKYGGPWMIMDHYLIVKEWSPNFDPMTDKTEKVIVWVRFPGLPMEYYDNEFLFRIGEKIGRPIRIDSATSLTTRGKFARLCVEVDITKPLLAKFWLRRRVRRIEYEGMHLVYFKCGIYGHGSDACAKNEPEKMTGAEDTQDTGGEGSERTNGQNQGTRLSKESMESRPEVTESFGPWMIASKNMRRQNMDYGRFDFAKKGPNQRKSESMADAATKGKNKHGSRFVVLNEEESYEEGNNTQCIEDTRKESNSEGINGPS